ncbi:MAG: PRC-barrel domain-containing protein [Chloroflexi bacterium]|nr:PRC-barrel domain-containing protein [Chloroflexota bacterium]
METTESNREVMHMNDLDRPAIPTDIPDYRDLMVIDLEGQQLGRIVDVILDKPSRKPILAVVLFGGFLDMGAKHVLVPHEWLHDPTPSTIRGNLTRYQAEQAPDFDPKSAKDIEPYYQYWFANEVKADASSTIRRVPPNAAEGHTPLVRVSQAHSWQIPEGITDLRGRQVVDEQNQPLGAIDDWFLNVRTGKPEILVVRQGGLFGAFSNECMIPYDRVEEFGDNKLRAAVSAEEIGGAPQLKDEIVNYHPFFEYWEAHPRTRDTAPNAAEIASEPGASSPT